MSRMNAVLARVASVKNLLNYEFRTLRERLTVWMIVLVLIPVLLLVGIGLTYAERQLQQRVMEDLSAVTQRLQYELHQLVMAPVEDIRIASRSPYLHQAMTEFSAVYQSDDLYSMDYQAVQDKYWMYLSFFSEKRSLQDLILINRHGDVIYSATQSDLYGRNLRHVDFTGTGIQTAFEQALWQMDSTVAIGTVKGSNEYAYMASPVVRERSEVNGTSVPGGLHGVVMLIPGAANLRQLLSSSGRSGQSVSIYRLDPAGNYAELLGTDVIPRSSDQGRIFASAALGEDFNGELSGWDNVWLASVRALPALDSIIVVRRDKAGALAAVTELRYSGVIVTLIILVLTVLISRHVALNLTAPVSQLSQSIEMISKGQRDVRVDIARHDELGKLARQFNAMAASLRSTQAQLLQTEKMASIGHLAAGVAHEINNPMSVVSANMMAMQEYATTYVRLVEMFDRYLQTDPTDEEARGALSEELSQFENDEDIAFVHQDMKALLEDSLLGLSRVKNIVGSLKVFSELDKSDDEEVNLRDNIEIVVSQVAPPSEGKLEINYQFEIDGKVSIKPEQMRKVFAAIIDNAAKACSEKGSLRIHAWRKQDTLIIDFQDTGCGMDEEQINRVFDPFYTTREVGEGIGLGLSIAHSIVEAHGGRLLIASRAGRGTRVRIVLPGR